MKLIDEFNNIEQHLEGLGISRVDDSYSEENLIKIEEEYGIEFPDIYKLFVLKYGNSTFEHDIHYRPIQQSRWSDFDGLDTFGAFFGFEERCDNLEENIKQYHERIPDSIVPIADDSLGNRICLGVRGDHAGKVYFWDHENELTAKVMLNEKGYEAVTVDDYWENVSLVAETFLNFIKSFEFVEGQEELEIESKIVSVRMSDTFMAEMLAARAKLESEEKTKGKR